MKIILCIFVSFLGACSANNLDKSNTDPSKAKDYMITRQFQRVVRYNCAGTETSDQIETVSPPNIFVKIDPKTDVNLDRAEFTDVQTGSQPHCFVSLTQFNIDTSPTTCNMQVVVGVNEIKYSFYYCDAYIKNADGSNTSTCASPTHIDESGSLFINVKYQEQTLEGKTEVRPQPTDCTSSTTT